MRSEVVDGAQQMPHDEEEGTDPSMGSARIRQIYEFCILVRVICLFAVGVSFVSFVYMHWAAGCITPIVHVCVQPDGSGRVPGKATTVKCLCI